MDGVTNVGRHLRELGRGGRTRVLGLYDAPERRFVVRAAASRGGGGRRTGRPARLRLRGLRPRPGGRADPGAGPGAGRAVLAGARASSAGSAPSSGSRSGADAGRRPAAPFRRDRLGSQVAVRASAWPRRSPRTPRRSRSRAWSTTSRVRRAMRTGFPFLDDGGPVLAFAHRGGARHPDLLGRENTMAAFAHAVALGLPLPRDRRAPHPRRGAGRLPRRPARPGHRRGRQHRRPRHHGPGRDPGRRRSRSRPSPSSSTAFPEPRFNIDLKADAAVEPLARFVRERGLAGPGAGRVVLGAPAAPLPPPGRAARADVRLPGRGRGVRRAPGRARPPAHPRARRAPGPAPASVRWSSPRRGWYAAPTPPVSTSTSGPSTTRTRCAPCSTAVSTA